ncbi:VOC family protein [Mesorhizobium sp. M0659]
MAEIEPVSEFYQRVFGAEVLYHVGPVDAAIMPRDDGGRDWTEARLGIAGAQLQFVMLSLPGNIKIEVTRFAAPAGRSVAPLANNEIGASHLGLEVDDLETAAGHVRDNGCTVFERIDSPPDSATAGISYRFFRDPWGNIFELCGRYAPNATEGQAS